MKIGFNVNSTFKEKKKNKVFLKKGLNYIF